MTRQRSGRKTGRKSELTEEQTDFLESYGARFQATSGHNAFYTEVVNKWVEKISYTGFNPNAKANFTISDLQLDVEDIDQLGRDERKLVIERRESARNALRTKLSNWFRYRYTRRQEDKGGVDDVLQSLIAMSANRPHKKTELTLYTELYWESKLKEGFSTMWSGCQQTGVPAKSRISFVKKYCAEHWANESDELRLEIAQRCKSEHAEAMQAWKGRAEWTASAETYKAALANLDAVLPPFTDAISKYTGMVTIVTMVGPSGEQNGDVVVRSTQSVTSKDKHRQSWAQADPLGYKSYQDALLKYGDNYYTRADRLARVVSGEGDLESDADEIEAVDDDADENVANGPRAGLEKDVVDGPQLGPERNPPLASDADKVIDNIAQQPKRPAPKKTARQPKQPEKNTPLASDVDKGIDNVNVTQQPKRPTPKKATQLPSGPAGTSSNPVDHPTPTSLNPVPEAPPSAHEFPLLPMPKTPPPAPDNVGASSVVPVGQALPPLVMLDPHAIIDEEAFDWTAWQSSDTSTQQPAINMNCLPDPDPNFPVVPRGLAYHALVHLVACDVGTMDQIRGTASSYPGHPGTQGFATSTTNHHFNAAAYVNQFIGSSSYPDPQDFAASFNNQVGAVGMDQFIGSSSHPGTQNFASSVNNQVGAAGLGQFNGSSSYPDMQAFKGSSSYPGTQGSAINNQVGTNQSIGSYSGLPGSPGFPASANSIQIDTTAPLSQGSLADGLHSSPTNRNSAGPATPGQDSLTPTNDNSVHDNAHTPSDDPNVQENPDPTTTPGKDSSAGAEHSSSADHHTTQDVHDPTTTPGQDLLTGVLSSSTADNQHGAHNKTAPAKSSDVGPPGPRGKKWKAATVENIDPSTSDLPSRRVRNLPTHLKESGYTAPMKGSRGAASTSATRGKGLAPRSSKRI